MADPRFYDNRGPFSLAEICARASVIIPEGVDGTDTVADLADLDGAGASHLTFAVGRVEGAVAASCAGWCFVGRNARLSGSPGPRPIACDSVQHAFAAAAALFYPDHGSGVWDQSQSIHPTARLEES